MHRYLRLVGACVLIGCALSSLTGCGKQPIAIVGQHKITRTEFLDKLEKDNGREALIGMINRKVLEDAFDSSGFTVTPEEVQERMKQMKDRFPSPEVFVQTLAAQGMTEQDVVESISLDLKLRKLCTKDVKVTEEGLKEFFEQFKDRFAQAELVNYSEIVVSSEEEAKKVSAELKKDGASFEALAKQHSISPLSRERGGKLPPTAREGINPPSLQQVVLGLKEGAVSAPINLDDRWYIVRLDSLQPARQADFKRDREMIEEQFKLQSATQPQELLVQLRQKAVVNVVDPKYADINDMFRPDTKLPEFGAQGPASGGAGTAKPAAPKQNAAPSGKPAGEKTGE